MNRDNDDIRRLRLSYEKGALEKQNLSDCPQELFKKWFDEAVADNILEANAVQFATVDATGQPSIRTLLLKEILEEGYVFYTNYESRKGRELEQNNKASFLLFWRESERQVRVEGMVEKLPESHSIDYYHSRPKGSQIGAWASPQSQVIKDRSIIEQKVLEVINKFDEVDHLPKPPQWGGYILKPTYFEFWQGRENRLHDRFEYKKNGDKWIINRLAP